MHPTRVAALRLVVALCVILVSCGGSASSTSTAGARPSEATSSTLATTTIAPPTTTTTVVTTTTELPQVLPVASSIDLSPVPFDELADLVTRVADPPSGMQNISPLAEAGWGGFTIAIPFGWEWWLLGQDPQVVADRATEMDPGWGEVVEASLIFSGELGHAEGIDRAFFIDPSGDDLHAVSVGLSQDDRLTAAALPEVIENSYAASGEFEYLAPQPVGDAMLVETVIRFGNLLEFKTFVLHEPSGWLWSATCTVHLPVSSGLEGQCLNTIRSFRPFGPTVP